MAFRQPTHHAPQRVYTAPEETQTSPQTSHSPQHMEESQEWILFNPSAASTTDRTYTTSTERSRPTPGRSRASDYGSLDTAARSYDLDDASSQLNPAADEEDEELDSLDSHLGAFRPEIHNPLPSPRELPDSQQSQAILPTHDGLGSFRIDQTIMNEGVQQHLYAFEQYNPRRIKRRRESLELGQLSLENERAAEAERTRRIEAWRIEQSRVLVEEIQKETRRRRMSVATSSRSILHDGEEEELATLGSVGTPETDFPSGAENDDARRSSEHDGFWSRVTRRVIKDLIGIDDDLLSILFGEALPEEDDDDLSTTPPANDPFGLRNELPTTASGAVIRPEHDSWEYRLLERIARELGLLVNQLSDHPGAFSTYLSTTQTVPPYAGLPAIPESERATEAAVDPLELELRKASQDAELGNSKLHRRHNSISSEPHFHPTLPRRQSTVSETHKSAPPPPSHSQILDLEAEAARLELERRYWEKDLDVKMVFRYLRSRFSSSHNQASSLPVLAASQIEQAEQAGLAALTARRTSIGTNVAVNSTADTAARAARVRQSHPLIVNNVNKMNNARRKSNVGGSLTVERMMLRRNSATHSSCASQSTRKSKTSSRHYWDIGASCGSLGSGGPPGGLGGWGEV